MKRKYIAPTQTIVALRPESVLCISMGGNEDHGVAESPKFRGGFDWDSSKDSSDDIYSETAF